MISNWPSIIAHADMDAFYASAEQLDDPALQGRAIIVGPNSLRGVVLTCSYEARKFGVRSAMPLAEAIRRCPDALVVPPRFERYQELSESIMRAFADFSPKVEAISLDEAFIDMTGAERIFGPPTRMAELIQESVYDVTGGLTASVGVASTKYVAKVASDFYKPNGLTIIPPEDAVVWLDPMPVSRLWGAGPKTVPRLERLGLFTIGDIRRADEDWLHCNLGQLGSHFQRLANAQDPRRVARKRVARSMGSDRTLLTDVSDPAEIEHFLRRSADRLGRRLRDKGYRAHGVRVKLKTTEFQLKTRQALLPQATDCAEALFSAGKSLLAQFPLTRPYRLVGLAAYDLSRTSDPEQLDLFSEYASPKAIEKAVDELIHKFGAGVVTRAADLGKTNTIADKTPNLDFIEQID